MVSSTIFLTLKQLFVYFYFYYLVGILDQRMDIFNLLECEKKNKRTIGLHPVKELIS